MKNNVRKLLQIMMGSCSNGFASDEDEIDAIIDSDFKISSSSGNECNAGNTEGKAEAGRERDAEIEDEIGIEGEGDGSCGDIGRNTDSLEREQVIAVPNFGKNPPAPDILTFTGNPGLKVYIPENYSEIEFFELLFTDELIDLIVTEINKFSSDFISKTTLSENSRVKTWKDISSQDLRVFFLRSHVENYKELLS